VDTFDDTGKKWKSCVHDGKDNLTLSHHHVHQSSKVFLVLAHRVGCCSVNCTRHFVMNMYCYINMQRSSEGTITNPNNLLKYTYAVCNFDEPMVSGMLPVNSFDDRSLQTQ
jgi:hypothetical protein